MTSQTTMKKTDKSKRRQRTWWVLTHRYSNGFVRGGIVKNSKLGTRFDVIAFEDYIKYPNEEELQIIRHYSIDEALAHIDVLMRAIQIYLEKFKPITDEKLREIYNNYLK